MKTISRGQSLIEVVFAVGLIAMVVTGIIALVVSSLGTRTKGYDRKKAVELSQIVMENLINKEKNEPDAFWNISSAYWSDLGTSKVDNNFSGYAYSVRAIGYSGNNCSTSVLECLTTVVQIGWSGVDNQRLDFFNRFFSKK